MRYLVIIREGAGEVLTQGHQWAAYRRLAREAGALSYEIDTVMPRVLRPVLRPVAGAPKDLI
jgi:hypothetical protein